MSLEDRRLRLQSTLESILGSRNVYFQADNVNYLASDAYDITFITKDPASDEVNEALLRLPYCRFSRHYTNDNLHHFNYSLRINREE